MQVWAFAGRTYHIVVNIISRLNYSYLIVWHLLLPWHLSPRPCQQPKMLLPFKKYSQSVSHIMKHLNLLKGSCNKPYRSIVSIFLTWHLMQKGYIKQSENICSYLHTLGDQCSQYESPTYLTLTFDSKDISLIYEPQHEISNNVVCATKKSQISLRVRAVWSEPLLVAWIFYDCYATDWTTSGVSKLTKRLHRLLWVYTCRNAILLEICRG